MMETSSSLFHLRRLSVEVLDAFIQQKEEQEKQQHPQEPNFDITDGRVPETSIGFVFAGTVTFVILLLIACKRFCKHHKAQSTLATNQLLPAVSTQ